MVTLFILCLSYKHKVLIMLISSNYLIIDSGVSYDG